MTTPSNAQMKTHDVQSIRIAKPAAAAFAYIAEPTNLPNWTNAFAEADAETARLRTPDGEVPIRLETRARADSGTVDWRLIFPDQSAADAFSRVTPDGPDACVYSFVLMAPPAPLEQLEGALQAQMKLLAEELVRVKAQIEHARGENAQGQQA